MPRDDVSLECKVYVGDLPSDATEKELERAFSYYGPLKNVWVARNPPGFAFIQFEDRRDADDAVHGLDGTTVCGVRVRVEHSSGRVRPKPWLRDSRRGYDPNDRCFECGERGHYAYDCRRGGSRYGSRRGRSYSRSRSRSRDRYRRSSRSRSRDRYRSRSKSRDRSRSKSPRRSVSRDRSVNGD